MDDQQPDPEIQPLHFVQATVYTIRTWPERTSFGERMLTHPHQFHASIDGNTITFNIFNGSCQYRLRHDLPLDGENVVADLIEGSDKVTRRKVEA